MNGFRSRSALVLVLTLLVGTLALAAPFFHDHPVGQDGNDSACTACKWTQAASAGIVSTPILFFGLLVVSLREPGFLLPLAATPFAVATAPRGPPLS